MADYVDAAEAAHRLGVSRQSLYAYVSRGLIKAAPAQDPRQSRYLASAVDQLAETRRRGRKPKEIAKATLDWGMPVLESALTLIDDGQLSYRGRDAVELARTATLEETAALLWNIPARAAFPRRAPASLKAYAGLLVQARTAPAGDTLLPLFAVAASEEATSAWRSDAGTLAPGAGDLVRLMAAAALRQAPASAPIHQQLATAWGVGDSQASLIRQALVPRALPTPSGSSPARIHRSISRWWPCGAISTCPRARPSCCLPSAARWAGSPMGSSSAPPASSSGRARSTPASGRDRRRRRMNGRQV